MYFSASWECYLVSWDSASRSEQAEIHSFQTSRTGWSRQSCPQVQQRWFVPEPKKNMNVREEILESDCGIWIMDLSER